MYNSAEKSTCSHCRLVAQVCAAIVLASSYLDVGRAIQLKFELPFVEFVPFITIPRTGNLQCTSSDYGIVTPKILSQLIAANIDLHGYVKLITRMPSRLSNSTYTTPLFRLPQRRRALTRGSRELGLDEHLLHAIGLFVESIVALG